MAQDKASKSDITSRKRYVGPIANCGSQIERISDHAYKIKSQSGEEFYEVIETEDGITCICSDFVYHGDQTEAI